MRCIYCGVPTTSAEPVEHIALEGLVGDQTFNETLGDGTATRPVRLQLENGEVCGSCNRQLSPLDSYVQKQFGFLKVYWNPVGNKRGRPATAVRPGMHAEHRPDGLFIVLNGERRLITTPSGTVVQPAQQHPDAVRITDFHVTGPVARITLQQPIRVNKRFMRGLHKIGFELLCFRKKAEFVLNRRFDPLRDYIRYGSGSRPMVLSTSGNAGSWTPNFTLKQIAGRDDWIAILQLAATFFIDLSPDNDLYQQVDVSQLQVNNLLLWTDVGGGKAIAPPVAV